MNDRHDDNAPARLLLVDDDASVLASLRRAIRAGSWEGFSIEVETFTSGAEALERMHEHRFDVLVSDLRMPGMDGLTLLAAAADIQPECVRLILSGTADFQAMQTAVNGVGIMRYLTKPWDTDVLIRHIDEAMRHSLDQRRQRDQATQWAVSRGEVDRAELERRRLEELEPGITRVEWAADGSIVISTADPMV